MPPFGVVEAVDVRGNVTLDIVRVAPLRVILELELERREEAFGDGVEGWEVSTESGQVQVGGAWNYIRATSDVDSTDPIDRLPHNKVEGWVQATPDPHISLIGRVLYFGESIDQNVALPGYTTVELTATSPISKTWLAVLKCEDLLSAAPQVRAGYHTVGRVVSFVLQGTWQ